MVRVRSDLAGVIKRGFVSQSLNLGTFLFPSVAAWSKSPEYLLHPQRLLAPDPFDAMGTVGIDVHHVQIACLLCR